MDVDTGSVRNLRGEGPEGAWSIMDVSHDLVVACYASLNTAPKLVRVAYIYSAMGSVGVRDLVERKLTAVLPVCSMLAPCHHLLPVDQLFGWRSVMAGVPCIPPAFNNCS